MPQIVLDNVPTHETQVKIRDTRAAKKRDEEVARIRHNPVPGDLRVREGIFEVYNGCQWVRFT